VQLSSLHLYQYCFSLTNGNRRHVLLVCLQEKNGKMAWGEIAPLPGWSQETVAQAIAQIKKKKKALLMATWTQVSWLDQLRHMRLLPSVSFGLESALFTLLCPIKDKVVENSALLMGSSTEILQLAKERLLQGFTCAKLKVSQLCFSEAEKLIHQLKKQFLLRIDVNQAWSTKESLNFFSKFSANSFDYVEEPFSKPSKLHLFPYSIAIDESYPQQLSSKKLQSLTNLKALIYKPTIQGGISRFCPQLLKWIKKGGCQLVISSSFESEVGLLHCAALAARLNLKLAIGAGTYFYLKDPVGLLRESASLFVNQEMVLPNKLLQQLVEIEM